MFIHDVLLEILSVGHTDIFLQNLPASYKILMRSVSNSTHSRMEEEFNVCLWLNFKVSLVPHADKNNLLLQYLNEIEDVKESQFKDANKRENVPKNRSQTIIPCTQIISY